jgi:hypothetical protein
MSDHDNTSGVSEQGVYRLTDEQRAREQRFRALRGSGWEGPIDGNGYAVMTRTSPDGAPLPLFEGGTGYGPHGEPRYPRVPAEYRGTTWPPGNGDPGAILPRT